MKQLKLLFISSVACFSAHAQLSPMGVDEAKTLLNQPLPAAIETTLAQTPKEYTFLNSDGENTVNYQGQVMRQVLINDSKLAFSSLRYGSLEGKFDSAYDRLNAYYQYNVEANGETPFQISARNEKGEKAFIWEGILYKSIFPRAINLKDKMAGIDNPLRHGKLLGWNSESLSGESIDHDQDGDITPAELYETILSVVAKNASGTLTNFEAPNGELPAQVITGAHITKSGLDLAEMSQKLLHSVLTFSQAAGDYTSVDLPAEKKKGLLGDNEAPLEGRTYTVLQHHWDEAFGYFGAARNFLDYTDEQISRGFSLDSYESSDVIDIQSGDILYIQQEYQMADGEISLSGEKNLGMSGYAGKRDLGAQLGNEDFTGKIMEAFLKGRHLIQDKPEGYLKYAQAYGVLAINEWERVMAASVIHYLNATVSDLQAYGTQDFKFIALAKHFSEMKGIALGFQFNPNSVLFKTETAVNDATAFIELHKLMGDQPVTPGSSQVQSYIDDLLEARAMLQEAYGFDQANVEGW